MSGRFNWPRGRFNGRRIVGVEVKFSFSVAPWFWRWHWESLLGEVSFRWLFVRINAQPIYHYLDGFGGAK